MTREIDIVALPAGEWRDILASAAELDLIHGGYFRARGAEIVFYCSPENAPDGWPASYPDGSPELPRAAVGTAELVEAGRGDIVNVRLLVSNWAAVRAVKQAHDRGEFTGRFQEYVLAQEAALRGRPEDRAWLTEQWERLRSHAAGTLVDE